MEQIQCLFCEAPNPPDSYYCANCERSLVIGKLASLGTGVLPKGFTWDLRPKEMTLGRSIGNDFVIPSNMLAGLQLRFIYNHKSFSVAQAATMGECRLNDKPLNGEQPLTHGDVLKVGQEELVYSYTPPADDKVLKVPDPTAAVLQLTLGVITSLHASANLQEVLNNAVDAVLRLTHTQRGYVFLIETSSDGEVEITEVAARSGGKNLPERPPDQEYRISRSVIEKVLASGANVLIEDAHERGAGSETMHRFSLRSVICLPLATINHATGGREVIGVVYTDSPRPSGSLPKHSRTALPLLADVITSLVIRWQKVDATARRLKQYEEVLVDADVNLQSSCARLVAVQAKVSSGQPLSPADLQAIMRDVTASITELQSVRLAARQAQQ